MAGFGSLLDPWKRAEDYAQELAHARGPSRSDAAHGVPTELERLLRPSFQHVVKLARRYESASRNAARRRVQRPAQTEEQREERTRAAFMRAYLRFENTLRHAVGDDRIGAGAQVFRRAFADGPPVTGVGAGGNAAGRRQPSALSRGGQRGAPRRAGPRPAFVRPPSRRRGACAPGPRRARLIAEPI